MQPRFATPPGRPAHPAGLALGVAAAVAVLVGLVGPPGVPAVGAQAGPQITVEAVHPLSGGEFHFIVALADGNGDPLSGTTVTATPTSPSGTTGEAVALPSSGDGTYQGPVPLPEDGTWMVRIASADPAGAIDYGFQVDGDTGAPAGPAPTTAPPATAAPATTAPPATTTPTTAPATTATTIAPEAEETAAPSSDEDDDNGFPVVVLIIAVALVVALAGVPLALRTIRSSTADDPPGPSSPPETPGGD